VEASALSRGGRSIEERPSPARLPDRLLRWVLTGLAIAILLLIAFFFVRLAGEASPIFSQVGVIDFVFGGRWVPSKDLFGAWPLLVGTLITSAIALLIGVPVAVASALYVT
jgi:ABC-type phosphate transport system permease subunit